MSAIWFLLILFFLILSLVAYLLLYWLPETENNPKVYPTLLIFLLFELLLGGFCYARLYDIDEEAKKLKEEEKQIWRHGRPF